MIKLDRLLDTKYTSEDLQKMISEYSVGQSVEFTEECILWLKENTYYMHTIGGKRENGIITRENAEGSLFVDLSIVNKYPYKAYITEFLKDVGDKTPGARIRIVLENGIEKITVQSVLDFYPESANIS